MKLRHYRKKNRLFYILIITITTIIFSLILINYFSKRVMPIFMTYAEAETKRLMTFIINKAVTKQMAIDNLNNDLFAIIKNDKGEIQMVDFNAVVVTKMLNMTTNLVQLNLKAIEEGNIDLLEIPDAELNGIDPKLLKKGIVYEIPVGTITKNTFLANLGPKIPVRMHLIGDVVSSIETDVLPYGINNAMINVGVRIEVSSRINLPFVSKIVTVETVVPIDMKVIQGIIPNYYINGFSSNSFQKQN